MLLMWIHPYLPLPSSPFPSVIRTERRRFIIVCINYASERERRPRDHLWSSLQWIEERIRNQQRRTTGLKTRQMMIMIVIHCITCFPCYSSCCCPFVEICMSLYILFRFSSRFDSMVVWYALIVYTFVIEYFAVDLNRKSFLSFTRDIHAISWSIHRWIVFLMSCPSLSSSTRIHWWVSFEINSMSDVYAVCVVWVKPPSDTHLSMGSLKEREREKRYKGKKKTNSDSISCE